MRLSLNVLELIYVTPCHFHLLGLNKITLIIETNRPSHSDTKKLDHFTKVTHYLLLSQLSIFQQKAERETIALLNELTKSKPSVTCMLTLETMEIPVLG